MRFPYGKKATKIAAAKVTVLSSYHSWSGLYVTLANDLGKHFLGLMFLSREDLPTMTSAQSLCLNKLVFTWLESTGVRALPSPYCPNSRAPITLVLMFTFMFYLIFIFMCFAGICACTLFVCLMPVEAGRGRWVS